MPIRRIVITTEVRLELSSKNLQSGTLSDTVRANESKYLTGTGSWETMEFERVRGVSMSDLGVQVGRQINDSNSFERASFKVDAWSVYIEAATIGERTS